MISTIIQLFAILLLAIVLYRESKRDRLAELRRREELHDLFRSQQSKVSQELAAASKTMISQILDQISISPSMMSIGCIQSTVERTHFELSSIKPLIQDLINARTQNTIKEGEANRTLRRRIQEKDAVLASTRQTIKAQELRINDISSQLAETRSAAKAALEHAISEINAIRSWMEERGIPTAPLDKHLAIIFKAGVPSAVYQRISNQDALKEAIGGTLTHLHAAATGIPLDAASNAATN